MLNPNPWITEDIVSCRYKKGVHKIILSYIFKHGIYEDILSSIFENRIQEIIISYMFELDVLKIEDIISAIFEKEDYYKKNKEIEYPKIEHNKGSWKPNEPFVLHFLLDGFLSDNLGNNTENVANRFIELLKDGIGTDWSQSLALEIEIGKKYGMYSNIIPAQQTIRWPSDHELYKRIQTESIKIPDIIESMIVAGGYKNYSKGGHATAFRFLPQLNQIIFVKGYA